MLFPESLLEMVTLALGTAPPCGSSTVPVMLPVETETCDIAVGVPIESPMQMPNRAQRIKSLENVFTRYIVPSRLNRPFLFVRLMTDPIQLETGPQSCLVHHDSERNLTTATLGSGPPAEPWGQLQIIFANLFFSKGST